MQPKDFNKKRFKLVPGADYSQSKYDTFGKMVAGRLSEGFKEVTKDALGALTGLTPEQLEGLKTATVNEYNEPIDENGNIIKPKAKSNPFSLFEFGVGSVLTKAPIEKAAKQGRLESKEAIEMFDIQDTIDHYADFGYEKINTDYLKGVKDKDFDMWFTSKGDNPGETFRGTHLNTEQLKSLNEGDYIQNKMPLSTSSDERVVDTFLNLRSDSPRRKSTTPTRLNINNKDKAQYKLNSYVNEGEEETIIAPDSLMRIKKIYENNKIKNIDLDQVGDVERESLVGKEAIINMMGLGGASAILLKEQDEDN